MLHVNEDNDELYRRAAEHYPLNTSNPDWKEVLKKMEEANAGLTQKTVIQKKKHYHFFILILLLIPLSLLDNKFILQNIQHLSQKNNSTENTIAENKTEPVSNSNTVMPVTTVSSPVNNNSKLSSKPDAAIALPEKRSQSTATANIPRNRSTGRTNKKHSRSASQLIVASNTPAPEKDDLVNTDEGKEAISLITKDPDTKTPTITDKKDSTDKKPAEEEIPKTNKAVANKESKKEHSSKKHFYIGLLAGPDISSVKLQSVKNLGFNIGLMAGYRLSKKFSIESGVFWIQKFYTSDGKYFNPKNITIPADVIIENLQGDCHMLEVPLNISYTFAGKPRSSWFTTAGVSAYFMKSESYLYDINYYGNTYPYSKKYNDPSTNLFSVINVSVGYTHKLGRIGNLRIEPYIKIPVKKIGTGSLPIQSTGINIGLTKTIF